MSKNDNNTNNVNSAKITKSFTNFIMYILFAVLILGLLFGIISILNSIDGMYLVYGEENITSDNNGISVEWSTEESEVIFTIQNSEDWGAYSVQDCTVKVIPNVSDARDFEFTVDGKTNLYSAESDLTAAFVKNYTTYDGNGLAVTEDGGFTLYLLAYTADSLTTAMPEILSRANGGAEIGIESNINLLEYPYFALEVTSPDGTVLTVAIQLYVNSYIVSYTLTNATAASTNVSTLSEGDSATYQFTASDGYAFPDEITVSGATLDSWDSATGTAVISDVTGNVIFEIECVRYYNIYYQLSNVSIGDGPAIIKENHEAEIAFTAYDGYYLSSDITVSGSCSYFWYLISDTEGYLAIENATGDVTITYSAIAEEKYTLSGVWVFAENLVYSEDSVNGYFSCNFASGGNSYTYMVIAWGITPQIAYGGDIVCTQVSGWADSVYRIIDFGEEQTVSEMLYNFITTYAEPSDASASETFIVTVEYDSSKCNVSYDTDVITPTSPLTVYVSATGDYMISYVEVSGALVEDGTSYSSTIAVFSSGTYFELSCPISDVTITVYVTDADL